MILFDLKLVIKFPSGSTILIPSSMLSHGNMPIQPGETRTSFTQYCPGGLLCWVEYSFHSINACALADPALVEEMDAKAGSRWAEALGRFSKLAEVHADRARVFQ